MSATFIPERWIETRPRRDAERKVYESLKAQLGDGYVVLHDVSWIGDSSDPRTADIQLDYIILHQDLGIIVVEVKGGRLVREKNSWYQITKGGRRISCSPAPHAQAKDNQYKLLRKLQDESSRNFPSKTISWAVCFPDCMIDASALDAQLDREVVIDCTDMEHLEEALQRIHTYWSESSIIRRGPHLLHQQHIDFVLHTFARDQEFKMYLGPSLDREKSIIKDLSEEQWKVFSSVQTQRKLAIYGCAGSGKTLLAQMVSRKLALDNKKVLLCCYNQLLREHLEQNMVDVPNVDVRNYDVLRQEIRRGLGLGHYEDDELDEKIITKLRTTHGWKKYDAIVLDEGQDFSERWLDIINTTLISSEKGVLYVFYDDNQRIYKRKLQLTKIFDNRPLTINFRTTKSIHNEIVPFYQGAIMPTSVGPEGEEPSFISYSEEVSDSLFIELRRLMRRLNKEGVANEDVVILTPRSLEDSQLTDYEEQLSISTDPQKGDVRWDTVRRFKGLEKPVVIITELDEYSISNQQIDQILYVAYSRACHRLFILHSASIPETHIRATHLTHEVDVRNIISSLNNEQAEAVKSDIGRILVWAGAGTGKTRVLTHRIAFLVNNYHIRPDSILAVTFTKKATREMQKRLRAYIDMQSLESMAIRTFHGMCNDILREEIPNVKGGMFYGRASSFRVVDDKDRENYCKVILSQPLFDQLKIGQVIDYIREYKPKNIYPHECPEPESNMEMLCNRAYGEYESMLSKNNKADFDDLINLALRLLQQEVAVCSRRHRRWLHILIDEFQDTDSLQFAILKLIHEGHPKGQVQEHINRSLFVVGDAQQSIYLFRNADYRIFMQFEKEFKDVTIHQLTKNYRSTKQVIRAALSIASPEYTGVPRLNLVSTIPTDGPDVTFLDFTDVNEEAERVAHIIKKNINDGVKPRDIAILMRAVRNQPESIITVDRLRTNLALQKVPTLLIGLQSFYNNPIIRSMVGYLRVLCNPNDDEDFRFVLESKIARGIGRSTVDELAKVRVERGLSSIWTMLTAEGLDADPSTSFTLGELSSPILSYKDLAIPIISKDRYNRLRDAISVIRRLRRDIFQTADYGEYITIIRLLTNFDTLYRDEKNVESFDSVMSLLVLLIKEDIKKGKPIQDILNELAIVDENIDNEEVVGDEGKVQIMTIHKAKGLEFHTVFVPLMEQGLFPSEKAADKEQLLEEGRICYVALTRAKSNLFLSTVARRLPGKSLTPSTYYNVVKKYITKRNWEINPYNQYQRNGCNQLRVVDELTSPLLVDATNISCTEAEWEYFIQELDKHQGHHPVILITHDDNESQYLVSTDISVDNSSEVVKLIHSIHGLYVM